MYKQTVEYTNFDGEPVSEILYFNLTSAEVTDMLATDSGFYSNFEIMRSKYRDVKTIARFVKDLILKSYGERTDNGGFRKNSEIRETFAASEAYSIIYMEFIQDPEKLMKFFKAVIPKDFKDKVDVLETRPDLLEKFAKGDKITEKDLEGSGLSVVKDNNPQKG